MKVVIITEGGRNIGFGHVTRCLSLCQAFEERGIIPEFIVKGEEAIKDLLKGKNNKILDWLKKEQKLFNSIKNADIVIIDSYLAEVGFYEKISKMISIPVYIDDYKRIDYPRGIIVNGSISAEKLNYRKKKGNIYLLGINYMPLRKEFWKVPGKKIRQNVKNIMITFGGYDDKNMTLRVLSLLKRDLPDVIKKVVIGKFFKQTNIKKIKDLKDKNIEFIFFPNAEKMKSLMLNSDIAISAGGQTLYELARIGVPTIALMVSNNQINNVNGWRAERFIEYAGCCRGDNLIDNLKKCIKVLMPKENRLEKHIIGKNNVTGLGALCIIDEVLNYYKMARHGNVLPMVKERGF